jgi:hypothetical protein
MTSYADDQYGGYQQGAQQVDQHLDPQQQGTTLTGNHTGSQANDYSRNDYYQQSGQQNQMGKQQLEQQYNQEGYGQNTHYNQQMQGQHANTQQGYAENTQYNQRFQEQQANTQQGRPYEETGQNPNARLNGKPGGQQLGAGEPATAAEQDGLHKCFQEPFSPFILTS